MNTEDQITFAIENPVRSRHHQWAEHQQREYNSMSNKGRRLYDNLRTQFDWSHNEAYVAAVNTFGLKPASVLDSEERVGIR